MAPFFLCSDESLFNHENHYFTIYIILYLHKCAERNLNPEYKVSSLLGYIQLSIPAQVFKIVGVKNILALKIQGYSIPQTGKMQI